MRNIWIVARRELGAFFVQPIAYVAAIALILVTGYLFTGYLVSISLAGQFGGNAAPSVAPILGSFNFLMLFVGPAITMRLLSEEQKSGTMELLMTLPLKDGEVVLGKFLAAFIFYAVVVALTFMYPIALLRFGNPDAGPIVTAYLGVLFYGAALLAIGVFASALTENQIVAFMVAFGIILILLLTGNLASFITAITASPQLETIFNELSLNYHINSFMTGLVTATDVLYYVLLAAIALFAATRVLESRRWR